MARWSTWGAAVDPVGARRRAAGWVYSSAAIWMTTAARWAGSGLGVGKHACGSRLAMAAVELVVTAAQVRLCVLSSSHGCLPMYSLITYIQPSACLDVLTAGDPWLRALLNVCRSPFKRMMTNVWWIERNKFSRKRLRILVYGFLERRRLPGFSEMKPLKRLQPE